MNIRKKTYSFVFTVSALLILIFYFIIGKMIGDSFQRVENSSAKINLSRVKDAILDDLNNLNRTAKDWSDWDDTYLYVKDNNTEFVKNNLMEKTFIDLNLNLIVLVDITGKIVYANGYNLKNQKRDSVPEEFLQINFQKDNRLFKKEEKNTTTGLLVTSKGPMLIVARPILTSFANGPVAGTLVFGRYFDSIQINKLTRITHLPVEILFAKKDQPEFRQDKEDTLLMSFINDKMLLSEYIFSDIYGKKSIKILVLQERVINNEWILTERYFTVYLILTGLIICLLMLILFENVVFKKLKRLNTSVSAISENDYILKNISLLKDDEISQLGLNINKMLERLENSQKKFKDIIEQSLVGIYILNGEKFTYVNPKIEEITGYTIREILDFKSVLDIFHEDDIDLAKADFVKLWTGEQTDLSETLRIIRKDKKNIFIEVYGTVMTIQNEHFVIGVLLDISERKKIEQSLMDSEKKYRSIVENTGSATIIVEDDACVSLANAEFEKLSGYSKSEIEGKMNISQFFFEDDYILMKKHHDERKINSEVVPGQYECKFIDRNGNIHIVLNNVALISGSDKSIISILDITEMNKTALALEQSEERLRRMAENIQAGITIVEKDQIVYVNTPLSEIVGYSLNEIMSMSFEDFIVPDEKERYKIIISDSIVKFKRPPDFETKIIRKDGTIRNIRNRYSFSRINEKIVGHFIITTDTTEILKIEERLRRVEVLESLGNLAGGVAHDLNNKLGPMVGYPDLLQIYIKRISEKNKIPIAEFANLEKGITTIKKAAHESAEEVQDLLTLARRVQYNLLPININNIIKSILEGPAFANAKQKIESLSINADLISDLMNIRASEIHLNKVIMNILVNALEAMPHGGILNISTDNEYVDESINAYDDFIPINEYVTLTIEDTGIGIKPEYLKKIFEPFFSKKIMKQGSGTGLGLAIVYGIVKDHNGFILLSSEYGTGTKFKIYFPATREKIVRIEEYDEISTGKESILIIDDDESQREIAAQILGTLGYNISVARNGREAVEIITQKRFDLILLDMIMEENFDGLATYTEILKIRPKQKAVIVSGFSENARVKETQNIGAGSFLRKPYTMEKIALIVRSELDSKEKNETK